MPRSPSLYAATESREIAAADSGLSRHRTKAAESGTPARLARLLQESVPSESANPNIVRCIA